MDTHGTASTAADIRRGMWPIMETTGSLVEVGHRRHLMVYLRDHRLQSTHTYQQEIFRKETVAESSCRRGAGRGMQTATRMFQTMGHGTDRRLTTTADATMIGTILGTGGITADMTTGGGREGREAEGGRRGADRTLLKIKTGNIMQARGHVVRSPAGSLRPTRPG